MAAREQEWLWGWDDTPGIVSVWAEPHGRATLWRRVPDAPQRVREEARFRPWLLLSSLADLELAQAPLQAESTGTGASPGGALTYRELAGPGTLRFLVTGSDGRALREWVLKGAAKRLGHPVRHLRELPAADVLSLPPEEQYLMGSGRTYFRGLRFDDLRRLQFDLETTGLDAEKDRIFLVALRGPEGQTELLEAAAEDDPSEAALLRALFARVQQHDPDVIENHNLHGFDLPFLARRAELLGVQVELGRAPNTGLKRRAAARGIPGSGGAAAGRFRYTVAGRELIDTLDAVFKYDFSARDLPGHGLKAVAKHLGISGPERELIPGALVHSTWRTDPARVRRYAAADVEEAAGVARLLGGTAYALAQMVPRRYERLADAGAATGVIEPLLLRAYLRERAAVPTPRAGDGTEHAGAALHLFAAGVAERVVKADVASLYPSLMRQYRIGPAPDRLGVLLSLLDRLLEQRLKAKAEAKAAPAGSPERHAHEAMAAAMKLVVNSAYGYLGAPGLTRFADVEAANEVTRRGRELLGLLCRELAARGVTLLEADTDGVYFSVPRGWSEADERRVVEEVDALLPDGVALEMDGRWAAMLSHEAKNYALKPYGGGALLLRGVAFRSRRAEPFGEKFLRAAVERLLASDLVGVRDCYVQAVLGLRRRHTPTAEVASLCRLSKTPEEYLEGRAQRKELAYEAVLASKQLTWTPGERVRVYRTRSGGAALLADPELYGGAPEDARDYDTEYYVQLLRESFAARLARAVTAEDFATLFADPAQPSLFEVSLENAKPILTKMEG